LYSSAEDRLSGSRADKQFGVVDCMIAAVAWRQRAAALACDADLDRVARVIGIELDQPFQEG